MTRKTFSQPHSHPTPPPPTVPAWQTLPTSVRQQATQLLALMLRTHVRRHNGANKEAGYER
ncbi:MAG TPA: hypothetical protein VH575_32135 [Gemmataceae bacterium]|jgi:hypothetical protein